MAVTHLLHTARAGVSLVVSAGAVEPLDARQVTLEHVAIVELVVEHHSPRKDTEEVWAGGGGDLAPRISDIVTK